VETDTQDIQARLPAALTGGGNMKADLLAINNVAGAAVKAEQGFTALVTGVVASGSTTTVIKTNITTVGPLNGRAITLTSGALMNVARTIVDHNVGTGDIQVVTLPGTPANGVAVLVS